MKVNVVDSIMGSGKTSAAINYIKKSGKTKRFLYVTPYLSEVERIQAECSAKNFMEPQNFGSKLNGLKLLLKNKENIVTTHALFQLFDEETIKLCLDNKYVLIMDEVANVVDQYSIGKEDARILLEKFVTIDESSGVLKWREDQKNYKDEKFAKEKHLCEMNSLVCYGGAIMLWMFPVNIFKAFRESYILTYMFNAQLQKYYYEFNGIEYEYLSVGGDSVDNYYFTKEKIDRVSCYNYKELINILTNRKMNDIGDGRYALSRAWYDKNKGKEPMETLRKNTYNFFTNKVKIVNPKTGVYGPSCSSNNIWTTFKDFESDLSGKRYSNRFVPSNMRATNDYKDCGAVAYLVNKFFNPNIKQFFIAHGITVDEDAYATSEMLQFLWRSAIRQGKPITVYIPSSRMRSLLKKWIAENSL